MKNDKNFLTKCMAEGLGICPTHGEAAMKGSVEKTESARERTDTERIDWLENNLPRCGAFGLAPSGTWQSFHVNEMEVGRANTLRELIDITITKHENA